MSKNPLRLWPYDPRWADTFAELAASLSGAIGAHVLAIEHVGSTSVLGIPLAKPVIDIAIAVASEAEADACVQPLQTLGWDYRGPHGDDITRRYYALDREGRRDAQIHLHILPAPTYDEKLYFRDRLRADTALRDAYAAEKQRAADAVAWDKARYTEAKAPFVERVLRERAVRPKDLSIP